VQRRYGDCKDKTYLLVSLLRAVGIEADPMLVSLTTPKTPARLLPTPDAFDHVVAQARINGRTVEEGEAMPFLDALDPPVLQRVQDTSIVVSHDGREYVVDLLANPVLQVGEPAVAAAAAAAPAAGPPAKQAAPAASPAPATGGSASGAAKPKGTYRVRGKNSKKP